MHNGGFSLRGIRGRMATARTAGIAGLCTALAAVGLVVLPSSTPAAATPALGPGGFTALPGARILDSRLTGGALRAGQPRTVQVSGVGGVPGSGVAAVALTVTVTGAPVAGHLAVYPDGTGWPGTSSINFEAGRTIANQTMVAVSATGKVTVRSGVGAAHVILDVTGWYAAGDGAIPGGFVGTSPRRLLDTRTTGTPLTGAAAVAEVPVAGVGDVPADATTAVVNVTAVRPDGDTYLTAWPTGTTRPGTSFVNVRRGTVVANLAVVGIGRDGAVSIAPGGSTIHIVVDLLGWTAPGPPAAGGIQPVAPQRLIDTRKGAGVLRAGDSVQAQLTGRATVPLSRVAAVVVTITAVPTARTEGYLTVWPSGTGRPRTSALNPAPDRAVASTGIHAVGADGGINIYNYTATVHLVIDITGYVLADAPAVAPAKFGGDTSPLAGAAQQRARTILANSNRHLLTTWWPGEGQNVARNPAVADGWRRLGMSAYSLAVALRTGGYDPAATGVDAATATAQAVAMIDIVTGGHRANEVGGWGSSWQSALFSSLTGRAAWMLWDDLPEDARDRATRMVEWEADQSLLVPTRYLRDRNGRWVSSGDSGAEENSWYALAPALAAAMFPRHPHWKAWRNRHEQLLVAAWARPSAVSSRSLVDGTPLSTWLGGSNVEATGAVINHRRVAPDYSTTTYQSVDTMLMSTLAGVAAPQASTWGLHPVYAAQTNVAYRMPTYYSPGGTVYGRGSATVYYPQGCD